MAQRFVTPEAVAVERELAGLGSRFAAALLDILIQIAIFAAVGIGLAAARPGPDTVVVVVLVTWVALLWVYPIAFETGLGGQTPGKRAARIRVVRSDGRPVSFLPVLVRNLLRIVDLLPSMYAVGAVLILVTPRGQRLGDLAAGTVVVYETPVPEPQELAFEHGPDRERLTRGMDVGTLTPQEYSVVRSFLLRRGGLDPAARAGLADRLADGLRRRVGAPEGRESSEAFLEAVAGAYRERWGSGP